MTSINRRPACSVSVVVCAYSFTRLRQVVEAVESALAQTPPPLEVVVVVDHNPELLAAIAAQVDRSVIVTDNTFARGLSGARNAGVAMACGDIVAFLDDDAIAAPDCFARLAERCAEADVIGAGALIAPLWASAPPSWFPPEFLWVVGCSYDGLQPGETRNLLGAAMCVRREAFASVGGFESGLGRTAASLPFGCEETEWCIRASQTIGGGRFLFDPQARVGHHVPAERASWRYFLRRCYAEGLSKAYLSRLVGTGTSLASERRYVSHALVAAIGRGVGDTLVRGDVSGLGRAAAVLLGLFCAAWGYGLGRARAIGRGARVASWLKGALSRHSLLFSNAGFLTLGAGAASFFGFFYWLAAARLFPPESIGFAAGGISLTNFISHLGEFGLGALMIGEAGQRERPAGLVSAALVASLGASAALAMVYVAIAQFLPAVGLGQLSFGAGALLFTVGCALSGLTLVLDQSLVGLMKSGGQVVRNVSFALVKLAALIAVGFALLSARTEVAILATWVFGQIASIALLASVKGLSRVVFARPDFGLLRSFGRSVIGHHALNLTNLAPGLLLPFVVTTELSPSVNAAFYAAWTIIGVAFLAPASLATVMFAVSAKEPDSLAVKLRASIGASFAVAVVVSAACWVGSSFMLGLFSASYPPAAASSLALLGLSVFPMTIKYHYVSIQRIQDRMFSASVFVVAGCALELAGAALGGRVSLLGLTVGWSAGLAIEAALMAPIVVRSAWPQLPAALQLRAARASAWRPATVGAAAAEEGR